MQLKLNTELRLAMLSCPFVPYIRTRCEKGSCGC